MLNYTYAELEKAIRGKLMSPTRRTKFKGHVVLDSRQVEKGDLFVALRGPKYDGHDFVDDAFSRGARLCIIETASKHRIKRKDPDVLFVENSLEALGRLGAFHRRRKEIPVIAITGSCGKTTTKEMVAHLLSQKFKVLKSHGSENNAIGVPKTLLNIDDQDIVVLELGTNRIGEIHHLTRICNPTHAVLTMIGNAHLAGFRSLQGVKREKLSLVSALEDGSTVIFNGEDKNIHHPDLKKFKKMRIGTAKRFDMYATDIKLLEEGCSFKVNGKEKVTTHLLGRHNVLNVLLAMAVAHHFKVPMKSVIAGIEDYEVAKGRMRYQEINGIQWIDDSYNSNPSSLEAALELFRSYPPKGRKVLVVGDMLELGYRANAFHREAGRSIAEHPCDLVLTVGEFSERFAKEAIFHGFDKKKIKSFKDSPSAGVYLKKELKDLDTILLKGSRGLKMDEILTLCTAS